MHAGRDGANEFVLPARAWSFLLGAGILFITSAAQSERPTFMLRPETGVQAGKETFELSATIPTTMSGVSVSGSSKLSYPVETLLAGGTLRFDIGPLSLSSTALTNLVNPWGNMVDQDWLGASVGTRSEKIEFSHTDSRTTLRALMIEGAARLRVASLAEEPGAPSIYAVAGFRFESSIYDAYGAWGWQLDENANQVPVSLPGDLLVLHYEVRHRIPFVGFGFDFGRGRRFLLNTEARLFPAWSSHDDDHVLRNKFAHASASGIGFALAAEPGVDLGVGAGAQVILGLSAQLQNIGTSGQLQQRFYDDDPTAPGNQFGNPIPDADFSSTSIRARLLAFVSVRF